MKYIFAFLIGLFWCASASGQTFTFECVCDQLTDDTCDICPYNPAIQSRSFHGLLIYRNGTPYKWIDEPYTIKRYANESLQFLEQIPAPDQVTIALFQTTFSTMQGFVDSTFCQCSAGGVTYIAGPGIVISGDTISAVDTSFTNELQHIDTLQIVGGVLQISLSDDGVPYSTVTLPVPDGSETKVNAGTGISVTGVGTIASPYIVTNTGDLSATNEAWTIDADDADTELIIAQTVKFQGAGIITTDYIPGTDILTITATEVDGSTSNELQTYGHAGTTTYTNTLSSGGGSWSITGAGIAAISQTAGAITVTATEVDGSISNEGVLGVGAGGASSSTLLSTTSGANAVTINAAGILAITESPSANGGSITLTATEVDGSVTNEAQALTISGTTTGIITLASAGGAGGGVATIAGGTGITVGQSGGTITITNSSPATSSWLLDGNTITTAKRIGSNDNFDVVVETFNTDRMWFDNGGTVSIGTTQLTTAAFNISGLQNNIGMHVAGGTGLSNPFMIQTRGNGSGSDCTVLDAQHSFLNGNVVANFQNTSTTGTGGVVITANAKTSTGDPRIHFAIDGVTDWSLGIDNDDGDALKLHKFAAPSDNNGVGTIEFGYNSTSVGISINKTGVLLSANYYALDALGKIRGDLFVNNIAIAPGTIALGTSAGTSPTLDNTVTTWWGNGGKVKFTSGSSGLTANSTLFTVTLDANWKFPNSGAPIVYAGSTSAATVNTSSTYVGSTGVLTCTISGSLTASTVYEFNVSITGD